MNNYIVGNIFEVTSTRGWLYELGDIIRLTGFKSGHVAWWERLSDGLKSDGYMECATLNTQNKYRVLVHHPSGAPVVTGDTVTICKINRDKAYNEYLDEKGRWWCIEPKDVKLIQEGQKESTVQLWPL